jgi:hypothetical protein
MGAPVQGVPYALMALGHLEQFLVAPVFGDASLNSRQCLSLPLERPQVLTNAFEPFWASDAPRPHDIHFKVLDFSLEEATL